MNNDRPNIVLLMTDQQRGDCLGIEGHPVVQTPNLDEVAGLGVRFRHGYSACPVCVPARRTLMTGQTAYHHGARANQQGYGQLTTPTLPQVLADHGYQTHLAGKLHLHPTRKRYGFHSTDWADGPSTRAGFNNDYQRYLRRQGVNGPGHENAHGVKGNGWVSRPWHLDESLHYSNWCAESAIDFLQRRDPTCPFFLKVSFFHPHPPCTPPQMYYDRYMQMDLPEPVVGDWARVYDEPARGLGVDEWRIHLPPAMMKQFRAGYFGCINHIDDQIRRVLDALPENTIVVFCSDHGEMLGDHQWLRKCLPYEQSARVPFLMRFPETFGLAQPQVRDEPVELMDLMPTLLDAAGAAIPDSVDGRSVLPLLRGETTEWREYIHGEHAYLPPLDSRIQWVTDGRRKFVWYPDIDVEHFFDVASDPDERVDLIDDPAWSDEIDHWRQCLAEALAGRAEEKLSDGRQLISPNGHPVG